MSSDRPVPDRRGRGFQIPMRGNERDLQQAVGTGVTAFQIPMRGNEGEYALTQAIGNAGSKSP